MLERKGDRPKRRSESDWVNDDGVKPVRSGHAEGQRAPPSPPRLRKERPGTVFPTQARFTRLAHKKTGRGKAGTGAHFLSFYFPSNLI
jgi:hypothetical protein